MANYFPQNLSKLRKAKGLTQQELADVMKTKRCNIGAYEEGRAEPHLELYLKFCDYLNVDAYSFFHINISDIDAKLLIEDI